MSQMQVEEFVVIIKKLVEENGELKRQVRLMEEILYSYLPIIENENENKGK